MAESGNSSNAGRIAFTYPDFSLYQLARFLVVAGLEMQSVAVGWQIYEITKRPLDLGLVGLAQFSPGILLFLVTGHAADAFNRRKLLMTCYAGFGVCSALLLFYALSGLRTVLPMYGIVVLLGVVRSFNNPASRSLLPQIIPEEHLQNAIAWNSSVNQGGTILGPSLGGLIYAVAKGPAAVYTTSMLAAAGAVFLMTQIKLHIKARPREPLSLKSVLAGLRYIGEKKIILGSISLDLFAVLLGGAVALLPVFAAEVLRTGPWGLGLLRASPAIGAGSMALLLAHRPFRSRAGVTMLWCVGGLWGLHDSLRHFSKLGSVHGGAHPGRVHGHGQRRGSLHAGAAGHAGRNARTRERRGDDLHRRFQRNRPVRIGPHRAMVRRSSGRDPGRNRNAPHHRAVGVEFSRIAPRRKAQFPQDVGCLM